MFIVDISSQADSISLIVGNSANAMTRLRQSLSTDIEGVVLDPNTKALIGVRVKGDVGVIAKALKANDFIVHVGDVPKPELANFNSLKHLNTPYSSQ